MKHKGRRSEVPAHFSGPVQLIMLVWRTLIAAVDVAVRIWGQ
ncbi:hypothetical protein [Actinocrispum wychmicini]|uniref:Uncharacterized protein n=1 Tax=Actinocrispum wychmicini TaxID=1213861 RepID=A0A4R2JDR3_9PSEU|nr:hypothetical protein [Actinocrispum wychmicini]TCO54976.1 hypothetical protein EV192_108264 [Actinocrispum wychmicini]